MKGEASDRTGRVSIWISRMPCLETVREKYGNLFDIYQRITGEDAYTVPMRIYPAEVARRLLG
jgi:hypothetical protein